MHPRPSMCKNIALLGTLVHTPTFGDLHVINRGALIYDHSGVITNILDEQTTPNLATHLSSDPNIELVVDYGKNIITPGLIDAHCHAPQYVFTGTGMDLPLLQWLNKYTFPCESRFQDLDFAKLAYFRSVSRHLSFGTTFCSYFGTIHGAAADVLVDTIEQVGQRAFVGKVSMDRNSPPFYIEQTDRGIQDAESFVVRTLQRTKQGQEFMQTLPILENFSLNHSLLNRVDAPLVLPCVTPRFVPTCTPQMLAALGALSIKYGLPLQSHLSESKGEMTWVSELHPEIDTYAGVYHHYAMLHPASYMAHCIHSDTVERALLHSTQCGVVHCASSNFNLQSGIMDCRLYLSEGVKVGLGTDVAGGHSASMLDAIRQTIVASTIKFLQHENCPPAYPHTPLTYKEALYLATMGSARVLNMDKVVGSLEIGKKLDILVVDVEKPGTAVDCFGDEDVLEKMQKWIFLGDDRNIRAVYVDGKMVLG